MFEPADGAPNFKIDEIAQAREHFMELSKQMEQGWIPQCTDCRLEEKDGEGSLRIESAKLFKQGAGDGIRYLDMDIHNTCNLMCRMCGPYSSSKWQQTVKQNPDLPWDQEILKSVNGKYGWHKTLDDVFELMSNVQLIKFTGGEPFLIPQMHEVIDHVIENNIAENITYHVTTNGTVDVSKYYDKLKKFKNIRISFSVDATGSRYEYIRPGADWATVKQNIQKLNQLAKEHNQHLGREHSRIGVVPCISILSFTKQAETRQWALDNDLEWYSSDDDIGVEILDPTPLTFAALKPHLREKYNVDTIFDYDETAWHRLCQQMAIQDQMFGTDFETECSELFE